jgi:hypothetical protein
MARYNSIEEFKRAAPEINEAMQCVFVSDSGEIHEYIIPVENWHSEIHNLMTSYVFINGWKSIVHTIKGF